MEFVKKSLVEIPFQKTIADIGHDTPLFKATKQSYNKQVIIQCKML